MRLLRAAAGVLAGLFVGGWALTGGALAVLAAAWAVAHRSPGTPLGFVVAALVASGLVLETVLAARRHPGGGR
jgi:hypothetical protein